MGRRGPPPIPSPILKIHGTYRKDRRRNEPEPEPGVPERPGWLDDDLIAKAAWDHLVPLLDDMGVLTCVDANALARYCVLWSRWRDAEQFVRKHGQVYPVKDGNGKVKCLQQFPQVGIANKLAVLLTRLGQEFGLTPSSRSRIQAPDRDEDRDDPLREFLSA